MVLVPLVIPSLPSARRWISLLNARTQITFRFRSCCSFFVLCDSFLCNWMHDAKTEFLDLNDGVLPLCISCNLYMASSVMTWCIACIEMLPGMRGWMILVERRGGVGTTCVVGWLVRFVSGSMTVYRGGVAIEIEGPRLWRPGRMSWMVTAEVFLGGPWV